jgi:PAS domain S-box-containing protein
MRRLSDLPLQRQLTWMVQATCILSLVLACTALATFEWLDSRQDGVRDLSTLADVLATTTQATLTFDDADAATRILKSLHSKPHILGARLFNRDGEPFADYLPPQGSCSLPVAPRQDGHSFELGHLVLYRPIFLDNKFLGTIYLQSDLAEMHHRLMLFIAVSLIVMTAALAIAMALSRRLQRLIAQPILALTRTAQSVAEEQNYTVRAPALGSNELGLLTKSFNHMLSRIQEQNFALTEGEERIRAVLNSALSAVILVDASGVIREWNAHAEVIFGWKRPEVLGTRLEALGLSPDDPTLQGRQSVTGGAGGPGRVDEISAKRRDGSTFPAELSVSPLKIGDVLHQCSFITDITERRNAQVKVQEQVSRLDLLNRITQAIGERLDLESIFQVVIRSLEDNLPIDFSCICTYDATAHSLTVGNLGSQCQSYAQALELTISSTLVIDQNGLSRCVIGKLVYEPDLRESAQPFPRRLVRAGLLSLVAAPLIVESRVFGVLLVARRNSQSFSSADCEFLRQLAEHTALASHSAQMYGALQGAYDDLRQTQQVVLQQERLRALGQMASGIAHDINNAISPVVLYTESLLENEPNLSSRARTYLETIQRAIDDVAHTVARMREFYRQRETQLSMGPVDVNETIQQVLDLTRVRWNDMPQQRGSVITTTLDLQAALPAVLAVASEVREALINLVFNGVDAMPEGGTLTLRSLRKAPASQDAQRGGESMVCVEVTDTGIGMSEETRRRCLEPFFTTKGERGTGLGLAMVYGVMQRHSGEIEVESEVGKGTTFRLFFPIANDAASSALAPAVPAPQRHLRLLIIDDDPLLLKSLSDILQGDGHAVVTADRGQAGIDLFQTACHTGETFAAVITDLGMPYVDGRKVASAIKSLSPTTPVIMLTGWGQRLVAEGDIPAHVDCVLNKPPKLRDLRTALTQHCHAQ